MVLPGCGLLDLTIPSGKGSSLKYLFVFLPQNLGEVVDRSAVGKSSLLRPLEEEEDSEEEEEEAGLEKPGFFF
jgi:hypothetical protein